MTPLDRIELKYTVGQSIKVHIKRDDLVHPHYCGNKWRKLKYQIEQFHQLDHSSIITWGGALSNHLHAISYLIKEQNIPVLALVPQDQKEQKPPSLKKAISNGLTIRYVSRSEYRQRNSQIYLSQLQAQNSGALLIPEGGSSANLLRGVEEMAHECIEQCPEKIDYWILPVGTGGTMLGILNVIQEGEVIGISAVKGGRQAEWIQEQLMDKKTRPWKISQDHHLGGMGKFTPQLIDLIRQFKSEKDILLDPVYMGKTILASIDLIHNHKIEPGSNVVIIHTGGYIGLDNFLDKNPNIDIISSF